MIGKELKKLNRRELVDIIYQLKKNEQEQQERIITLGKALQEKRIRVSFAGSIAEAATDITKIFSVAQETADLYLQEIAALKAETEAKCDDMIQDAKKKVAEILSNGEKQFGILNTRYKADYQKWQMLKAEIQRLEEMKNKG